MSVGVRIQATSRPFSTWICSAGTTPTRVYTLSLHDALPISGGVGELGDAEVEELHALAERHVGIGDQEQVVGLEVPLDRKSTRLNSSHVEISYAVFCLKKKK